MRLLSIFLLILLISTGTLPAQSFPGATGPIPDNGPLTAFPILVSGLSATTIDTSFGLESVCITISHTYVSDLVIKLQAPDGTIVDLSISNGGAGNNYSGTCFSDGAATLITSGSAPFAGVYRPQQPLYQVNNSQNPNGTWNLLIQDQFNPDPGFLMSCAINFGTNPGQPFPFSSSNLPIIKINTLGQTVIDDPKIQCKMKVIDNGPGNRNYITDTLYTYDGWIGIEIRGSSSQMFPKKSFGVETRDSMQTDTSVALLGMPPENDWVFNANYTDKTFMRNTLAYDLFGKMGRYSTRTRYAEVFINNLYQGIYVITEKIKKDSNRVDVANLTTLDNTWPDVSGGYILKVDKTTGSGGGQGFTSLFPPTSGGNTPTILFDYPSSTDITIQQRSYIVAYMDSFETALNGPNFADSVIGYQKYADMNSFIDFMLLNEVTKCVDSYRISSYLYKEKSVAGGKLFAGPVWDFDIAWGNADYYNGQFTNGWAYITNNGNGSDPFQVPFWWSRFMQDNNYKNAMKCRWNDLRAGAFSTASIHNWIDSVALVLNESQQRNFTLWPILGTYVWPNPSPIPQNYPDEVSQLKTWIGSRLNFIDNLLPGICIPTGLEETSSKKFNVYPNPATDEFYITASKETIDKITLCDLTGRTILTLIPENEQETISVKTSHLPHGIYIVQVESRQQIYTVKIVLQ